MNIFDRVAIQQNEIRDLPWFDRTQLFVFVQVLCGIDGCGLQCLKWRKSCLNQKLKRFNQITGKNIRKAQISSCQQWYAGFLQLRYLLKPPLKDL